MKITKSQLVLLVSTIAYIVIFASIYLNKRNYEFISYVGVLTFFLILIGLMHLRFHFTTGVLTGMSIWGLLHMSGGSLIVNGSVLYKYQIFSFLRFDQFVHLWGFGFATLLAYYVLRPYLNKERNIIAISVLLVFIGMGIGALNEIIEFVAVLTFTKTGVGGYYNNMWDMVFNTFGAIIAVLYINLKRKLT